MSEQAIAKFFRSYDLKKARQQQFQKQPAIHQQEALKQLDLWFKKKRLNSAGGILVLPTGGGKTFTAVRFLCSSLLSDGYKVLWLAHTHHLLEQAFYSFESEVKHILEPRQQLNVRVVSGTIGHFRVAEIKPKDDVVIATLQTITRAYNCQHSYLEAFLQSAGEKLIVVFDEAHHSPAPSYRKLIQDLQKRFSKMFLLGLTATPTHTDDKKRGRLIELFPQNIVYQTNAKDLMLAGILAQPIIEQHRTNIEAPEFDEREYQKWLSTYQDIPEDIIKKLAENRERNALIAETYIQNKNTYGKTLIFADRWYQCDQIRDFLRKKKIRADVIYSHIDADPGSAELRNKRTKDENACVLEAFRRNELDVLINVRMLTEGTDVPDVQTVFLTRQTTSQILLTQMVGRGLRGKKFGGTEKAYIVSFIDNWQHAINWAGYNPVVPTPIDDPKSEYGKRPPLQLISIGLVRRLIEQINHGIRIAPVLFLTLLPLGWYRVEIQTLVNNQEKADDKENQDIEPVYELLMVFENEKESYESFINYLIEDVSIDFELENVNFDNKKNQLKQWRSKYFPNLEERFGTDILRNIFHLARHVAQNKEQPNFFTFEERDNHDLDNLAENFIAQSLSRWEEDEQLKKEYERGDRYWKTIYYEYGLFKLQYNACADRIIATKRGVVKPINIIGDTEIFPERELSEKIKKQVKDRDKYRCLCCGDRSKLQVDHINAKYVGGDDSLSNLQTLCNICNQIKGTKTIDFRLNHTSLSVEHYKNIELGNSKEYELFIRRVINFSYQCAAVKSVKKIGETWECWKSWEITLYEGNDPTWLMPHLQKVLKEVQARRAKARLVGPEKITINTPSFGVLESII